MTLQSSFLIRCSLHVSGDHPSGRPYLTRHVQTGAEFRSATLVEATQWMADQNARYLAAVVESPAELSNQAEEDLR